MSNIIHLKNTDASQSIQQALKALTDNKIIVFPTETVYGLACRADSPEAIQKIFHTKQRPTSQPLTLHIGDISQLKQHNITLEPEIHKICETYWPGPLTIIDHHKTESIGIRCPKHTWTQTLLQQCSFPVVATSVNLSGKNPIHQAKKIAQTFPNIEYIFEDDNAISKQSSTIIDVRKKSIKIIRQGIIHFPHL
ncbi:threonylcarbamoyl-AMP synthase [Candidatus Peregrinibacteria bacterium]|nr:MAG: threonylcarbamoyl-AMP synthase [Candidatus Peregrinibacteria bacterium]